jgi:hypothetical protein
MCLRFTPRMNCVRYDAPAIGRQMQRAKVPQSICVYSSKRMANLSSGGGYFLCISSFPAAAICFTSASAIELGMAIDKLYCAIFQSPDCRTRASEPRQTPRFGVSSILSNHAGVPIRRKRDVPVARLEIPRLLALETRSGPVAELAHRPAFGAAGAHEHSGREMAEVALHRPPRRRDASRRVRRHLRGGSLGHRR